jgi:flagellar biosynthesis protein FlhF
LENFKIVCDTYEEAVNKARLLYGESMRISSRRDFRSSLGFGKHKCELTVFIAPRGSSVEHESPTEHENTSSLGSDSDLDDVSNYSQFFYENDRQKEQLDEEKSSVQKEDNDDLKILEPYLEKARDILVQNDFSSEYIEKLVEDVRKQLAKALPDLPSDQDFEMLMLDNIVSSFESDHTTQLYPPKFFVMAGASGVGKTAAASKIGNLIVSGLGKSVEVVELNDEPFDARTRSDVTIDPNGVFHTRHSCMEPLQRITGSANRDIYILDSFSSALGDDDARKHLLDLFRQLPKFDTKYFLVMDASMKEKDIVKIFSIFERVAFQSLILTKCDESETIGNVISVCNRYGMPLLFITDGKDLMSNIHFASSFAVLSKLKGFTLDISMLAQPNVEG